MKKQEAIVTKLGEQWVRVHGVDGLERESVLAFAEWVDEFINGEEGNGQN